MKNMEIVPLGRDSLKNASELLAQAFLNDPDVLAIVRGGVPKRLRILRSHYYNLTNMFLPYEGCKCAVRNGELVGIMLFSVPAEEIPTTGEMIKMLLKGLIHSGPAVVYRGMRSAMDDEKCRSRKPHYYLSTLGVEPKVQGNGIGSSLLSYLTARADQEKALLCLSSTNPKAIPLYEKFGFKTVLVTSPSGVPNHHMERTPWGK